MKANSNFDKKVDDLSKNTKAPEKLVDSLVYVADTVDVCTQMIEALDLPMSTSLLMEIYDRVDRKRRQLVSEAKLEEPL